MPLKPSHFEEPEALAVMNWVQNGSFVASANMHEGALVANYPWDASSDGLPGYAASPDDKTFVHLALVYSKSHGEMYKSKVDEPQVASATYLVLRIQHEESLYIR